MIEIVSFKFATYSCDLFEALFVHITLSLVVVLNTLSKWIKTVVRVSLAWITSEDAS